MPDWKEIVRTRLPGLPVAPRREAEIVEELAQQLEDAYAEARAGGASVQEATDHSLGQFPDWLSLHGEICEAEREDTVLNRRTRVFWLPSFIAIFTAFVWIVLNANLLLLDRLATRIFPGQQIDLGRLLVLALAPYGLAGAAGAFAAWRLGACPWQRLLAGIFPFLVYVAALLSVAALRPDLFSAATLGLLTRRGIWLLLTLLLGTAPFLLPGAPTTREPHRSSSPPSNGVQAKANT